MASKLGSGLEKLFGENISDIIEDIQNNSQADGYAGAQVLNIDEIHANPYQPRQVFDQDKLNELAQSIKEQGVFTPILVRRSENGYQLVAGERRLKASQLAGKTTIPAIIQDFTEEQMMEISLLENIQRENLNVIEEGQGYRTLLERMGYTQELLAQRVGKSREHISNTLRLLKLPEEVQKMVSDGKLSMGQVRPLITLENEHEIVELANKIASEGLSVRNVEKLIKNLKNPKEPTVPPTIDAATLEVQQRLQHQFQTRVRITNNSINISYSDTNDLNRILDILGYYEDEQ